MDTQCISLYFVNEHNEPTKICRNDWNQRGSKIRCKKIVNTKTFFPNIHKRTIHCMLAQDFTGHWFVVVIVRLFKFFSRLLCKGKPRLASTRHNLRALTWNYNSRVSNIESDNSQNWFGRLQQYFWQNISIFYYSLYKDNPRVEENWNILSNFNALLKQSALS